MQLDIVAEGLFVFYAWDMIWDLYMPFLITIFVYVQTRVSWYLWEFKYKTQA